MLERMKEEPDSKQLTWLPSNTLIRTPDGWVDIAELDLQRNYLVLGIVNGKIIVNKLTELSIFKKNTVIHEIEEGEDVYFAKTIIRYDDPKLSLKPLLPQIKTPYKYNGNLYHLETETNTLIFKSYKDCFFDESSYTIALCHVSLK